MHMTAAVIILHGPGHVVVFQSQFHILLAGLMLGVPIREAMVAEGRHRPFFKLLDDVYATGISLRVELAGGIAWLMRLADESGVGVYYERRPSLALPELRVEPVLRVPVG